MNSGKVIGAIVLACVLVGAVGYYLSAQSSDDPRIALQLSKQENAGVRGEMRKLLVSVSDIVAALDEGDMSELSAAARKSGMSMAAQVEVSLKKKLPVGFMKLGKGVHVGFDEIADAAKAEGASKDALISLLAAQLQRCVACHDSYRLE